MKKRFFLYFYLWVCFFSLPFLFVDGKMFSHLAYADQSSSTSVAMVRKTASIEDDAKKEAQLHSTFMTYYSQPVSDERWDSLLGDRQSEVYNVQEGDTLWGISKTFFGEGNYWPKIWALNYKITNPHQISPGDRVFFVFGTDKEAPELVLVNKGEKGPKSGLKVGSSTIITTKGVKLVTSSLKPVLKTFPPSLGVWSQKIFEKSIFIEPTESEFVKNKSTHTNLWLSRYIKDSPPSVLGSVFELEDGIKELVARDNIIHIRLKKEAQIGDRFSLGTVTSLKEPMSFFGDSLGHEVHLSGELEVISKLSSKSQWSSDQLYKARVLQSLSPISKGLKIFNQRIRKINNSLSGRSSSVQAKIIASGKGRGRGLVSPLEFVYINRGSDHGLSEGDILSINENRELRVPGTLVKDRRSIGLAKVVDVSRKTSTLLIIKTWGHIILGDYTGELIASQR